MRKPAAPFLALLAVLTTAVCADAARVRLPRPKRGFQMRMGKFTIPAAREREVCEFRTLPNRKPIDAQKFEFEMTPGSHHFALWAYLGQDRNPADFPQTIVDAPGCIGVGPRDTFDRALLGGAPSPHEVTRFPPGIAVRLAPHQRVILNSHYINGSLTDPLTPQVVLNVTRARPGTIRHHAEQMTLGDYPIDIPPLGTASLTAEWIAPFAYWPATPMRVEPGDGFRFTCEWKNDDDHPVRFGVTTNDEMCFMVGYYYRDDESVPPPPVPNCLLQTSGLLCSATTVP